MDGGGLKVTAKASISVKEQEDFDKDGIPNTEDLDDDNDGVRDEWDDDDDGIVDSKDRDFDFNYILPKLPSDSISSSSQSFFVRAGYFLVQLIVLSYSSFGFLFENFPFQFLIYEFPFLEPGYFFCNFQALEYFSLRCFCSL